MDAETSKSPRRYWCFISYRHADNKEPGRQWATWLHQAIETYEVPADLVGKTNERGDTIPERIYPVFRDEEELPANAALSQPIREAVWNSRMLLVLCSPKALGSRFVHEEITIFKSCRSENKDRVLAAILAGDPAGPEEGDGVPYEQRQCFPLALRFAVDGDGQVTDEPAEPVAPDFRLPDGTEGYTSPAAYREALLASGLKNRTELETQVRAYQERLEMMKLKIIAGILGVSYGDLSQRDKAYQLALAQRREQERRRVVARLSVLTALSVIGGSIALWQWREANVQRREAEQQAFIAQQTVNFVTGMFGEIDPATAQGREITVREVLDKASANIGTSFEGSPAVEWRIRGTLGEIYSKIGGSEQALTHVETMLNLAMTQYGGNDHPNVASAINNVAYCLQDLGRIEEALSQYQAALEMSQRLFPNDHPGVATSLGNVASCLQELGRAGEALQQHQAALGMYKRLFPGDHPSVLAALNNVALCLQSMGRSEEALPQLQATLEMSQRLFSGDHPAVALALNNVAFCLKALGRAGEALPQYQAALEINQHLFPGDHPSVATSLNNVAGCLQELGRAGEALQQHQAALEMFQRLFPGDHPSVAISLNDTALCLLGMGRSEEALLQLQAGLEMNQRLFPGDHPNVAASLNGVAYCLQSLGRTEEALPQLQAGLEMNQRLFPGDHPAVATFFNNVASCLNDLGRAEEALPQYQAALEMRQRLFPNDHPDVALSLDNVASCLNDLGRAEEALPQYQAALEMRQRLFPDEHVIIASGHQKMADCHTALGQWEDARKHYQVAKDLLCGKDLEAVLVVTEVTEGSQAEKLGIQAGDVVMKHGEEPVFSVSQFSRLRRESEGSQVGLTLQRDGQSLELQTEGGLLGVRLNIELRPLAPDDGGGR